MVVGDVRLIFIANRHARPPPGARKVARYRLVYRFPGTGELSAKVGDGMRD
jgi:hypothetical protein